MSIDFTAIPRVLRRSNTRWCFMAACVLASITFLGGRDAAAEGRGGNRTDGKSRYVHHIDLYDVENQKITPESTAPYSSINTCGRCHDYDSIAHGWHFNAFGESAQKRDGRPGEPWIWTDPRTGTQLPLSYRDWEGRFDPKQVGISSFDLIKQLGSRLPGGGVGADTTESPPPSQDSSQANSNASTSGQADPQDVGRWQFAGTLEIDCMICHAVSGAYDFGSRTEQIENENFAWAATAALRLGEVDGRVERIKDGSDPGDPKIQDRLPRVRYDASRFAADGTVFMDLVRHADNNACYQCHSNAIVDDSGIRPRWIHDDDVHIQAGMSCVDCHRNGIDHHIVRGFEGEDHPSADLVSARTQTLSCRGCHLGVESPAVSAGLQSAATVSPLAVSSSLDHRPGRLGSPLPGHAGLPPLHFEKLACTACHSGPIPRTQALGMMTSLAHGLGAKAHRDGTELPRISGPVYSKDHQGRVAPHKVMWPAYWAKVNGDSLEPIPPNEVYQITRRALRVRKNFRDEVLMPNLKSGTVRELLGEARGRVRSEERTDAEQGLLDAERQKQGRENFGTKVSAALLAIEQQLGIEQAAYVSAGVRYTRDPVDGVLQQNPVSPAPDDGMVTWPIAHNVRPAGWSLGVNGCVECHRQGGLIFSSTVSPTGPVESGSKPVAMAQLQGVDPTQRWIWNQMFGGRAKFKFVIAGSLSILVLVMLAGLGGIARRPTKPVRAELCERIPADGAAPTHQGAES